MKCALVAAAMFLCAGQADAAVEVFRASGSFIDGSTLSGTISIDTTAGTLDAVDLMVTGPDGFHATDFYNFYPDGDGTAFGAYDPASLTNVYPFANQFVGIIANDLIGYRGGTIYSVAELTPAGYNSDYATYRQPNGVDLAEGSLTPVPEPTTWISMVAGFGLLGAGVRARRVRVAIA